MDYIQGKNKLSIEIIKLYNFMKQGKIEELLKRIANKKKSFKERIVETFGENPFICSNCNEEMILWEIWLPKYGKIYNALERKNYFDIQKENRHEKKKEIEKYSFEQICLF